MLQFPYYIVRFKLTTSVVKVPIEHGFHTTQYDLNWLKFLITASGCQEFPYYIVRFKLEGADIFQGNVWMFPYYIVRFKLPVKNYVLFRIRSFHTTQYDLNMFSFSYYFFHFSFPYYIVRFKPQGPQTVFEQQRSFHTTQYDLNMEKSRKIWIHETVSILHSTI